MAQVNVAQTLVCALGNADRKSPPPASADGSLESNLSAVLLSRRGVEIEPRCNTIRTG
jgi:hypothetical protein